MITKKALVVGGINLDIQCKSEARFLPADSNPGRSLWTAGGVGRNIAENLVRLGVSTELVTVFGDGPGAAFLRDSCEKTGIRTDRSLVLKDRPCSQYVCMLDSDGSLVGAVADMEIFDDLTPRRLENECCVREAVEDADIVVLDANLPAASLDLIVRFRGDTPLLLDPVSRTKAARAASCVDGFAFMKPNREEAAVLSGCDTGTDEGLWNAARVIGERGVREVFISLGKDGILYRGAHERGIVRPPRVIPVNLSGAGDAAAAALAWAYLEGVPIDGKAALALGAAALTALSERTVSPEMNPARLEEICKGVVYERIS